MKRVRLERVCGVLVDVQEYFLDELEESVRKGVEDSTVNFVRLFDWLKLPLIATVEKPVAMKGGLPSTIASHARDLKVLEKEFFDLTKHPEIVEALRATGRTQFIVGGCETDVCVLQSCLGLRELGYEVFLVDELLFSSDEDVHTARQRLRDAGCVFVTQKTLFFELVEGIVQGTHRQALVTKHGPMPEDLF